LAATQRPFAARCLTDKAPAAIRSKTLPSWYVVGDADKIIPPGILQKFATRAKSKVYPFRVANHPSTIAHPEVTVVAIEDAANTVAH
jgi:pimeloyl-ACP methyl ester carboxylesterase